MRFLISALLLLGITQFAAAQTSIIALHHNGTPTYLTNLDSAVYYALPGDTIYLPGGDFFPDGGQLTISKEVHVFGVGYRADSSAATGPTRFIGKVQFDTGSDGSSMHGLQVTTWLQIVQGVSGITLSRLAISQYLGLNGHNNFVKECLIFATQHPDESLYITNGYGNQFFNCVIYGGIAYGNGNRFDQCIFQTNGQGLRYTYYSIYSNCIFVSGVGSTFNSSHLTFNHCLFSGSAALGSTPNVQGCVENVTMTDVLEDFSVANIIANDYHLKTPAPGSTNPAVEAGNLGQDCGIYDGLFPFKDNRHPSHPRISFKNIAPYTDAAGNLQIEVTVEAQEH